MSIYPHLPPAVDYIDIASLRDLHDDDLAGMLAGCRLWYRNFEDFRECLVTPVAQTLWKVLIVDDVVLVVESGVRIEGEMADRQRHAKEDES